jgi:hypothetical protein
MKYSLEPCFKVYDDTVGACLEVAVHPEMPHIILIHTPDEKSKDFYGNFYLPLEIDQALLLANAIIKQAALINEFQEKK